MSQPIIEACNRLEATLTTTLNSVRQLRENPNVPIGNAADTIASIDANTKALVEQIEDGAADIKHEMAKAIADQRHQQAKEEKLLQRRLGMPQTRG